MSESHLLLLVDDDPDIRDSLGALLECEGFSVAEAENGADALAKLRAGLRPCVIVLDLMMPVMDGLEFRRRQTADPALADIPVIVNSGVGDLIAQAKDMGVVACLRKPIAIDRLVGLVTANC